MDFIKKNKYVIIVIVLLSTLMFYFIGQKQGFHEDEIFSYGSSNYKYDNLYRSFGYASAEQDVLYNQVLTGNFLNKVSNFKTLLTNNDSFKKDENLKKEVPIFRTNEEALDYLVVNKNNIFNYFSVYYNQAIDVHPPLFYFGVHFISSLFPGTFSKYIIFSLNLAFFIGSLIFLCKIMKELNKEKLTIPTLILYGASTGAISTVMFQRMYMMLTFFCLMYFYYTLKFINNNFEIKNKKLWALSIICGFLTQYYFCIYIVLVFLVISIYLLIKKEYKKLLKYFLLHAVSAIICIVFYPSSIYHIFFSYRGVGATDGHTKSFIEIFSYFINQILVLFNIKNILYFILGLLITLFIIKIYKKDFKKVSKEELLYLVVLVVPILLFILAVSKLSPFLGDRYTSRYIMLTFPFISIIFILGLSSLSLKYSFIFTLLISLLLSINGLINNEPVYLYKDYAKAMDIANNNKDKRFVYIFDNYFTHISSLPEFATYKESIILNDNIHDYNLLNNEKLNNSNEFILCIKNWLDTNKILHKVLESTGYNNYEKILELNSDVESTYYRIYKKS